MQIGVIGVVVGCRPKSLDGQQMQQMHDAKTWNRLRFYSWFCFCFLFVCVSASLCYLCICICVCLTAATCCFNWATPTRAAAASAAGQIAIWRCDRQIMKCQESHLNDLMVRCRVPNAGELVNKQSTVAGLTCARKLTHTQAHQAAVVASTKRVPLGGPVLW